MNEYILLFTCKGGKQLYQERDSFYASRTQGDSQAYSGWLETSNYTIPFKVHKNYLETNEFTERDDTYPDYLINPQAEIEWL